MFDIQMAMRMLFNAVFREDPDEPIPPELQPPVGWVFNLQEALQITTVWDVLHAEEELSFLDELGASPLAASDGLALQRIIREWHNTSTPEEVGLLARVRRARLNNLQWRTAMETRRRHARYALEAGER